MITLQAWADFLGYVLLTSFVTFWLALFFVDFFGGRKNRYLQLFSAGLAVFAFLCGTITYLQMPDVIRALARQRHLRELHEEEKRAEELFQRGEIEQAIAIYKGTSQDELIVYFDRPERAICRILEHDLAAGNRNEVKEWLYLLRSTRVDLQDECPEFEAALRQFEESLPAKSESSDGEGC